MRNQVISAYAVMMTAILGVTICIADEPQESKQDIAKQIAAARAERDSVADKYNAIVKQVREDKEARQLNAEIEAAKKAVAEAEDADEKVAAARKAEADATAAFRQIVETKLAADAKAAPLLKQLAELNEKSDEHRFEIQLARFKLDHELSPINRMLRKAHPELTELKRQSQTGSRAERRSALTEYSKLRKAKLTELEEAKPLLAAISEHEAQIEKLNAAAQSLQTSVNKLRAKIESREQATLIAAKKATQEAANSETLNKLRDAHRATIEAYNEKVKALMAENTDAPKLRKQYDELGAKIRELESRQKPKSKQKG